jgi:hypothetical protein
MTTCRPAADPDRRAAVRRFVRHYLEMVVAMFVGMLLFWPLAWLLFAGLGAAALLDRPDVAALVMATTMTLGMTLWMRYRRHGWASTTEMGAAMYLSFLVVLVPFWLGAVGGGTVMVVGHVLMLPAMLLAMLLRRDEYSAEHRPRRRPRPADESASAERDG